MPLQVLVTFQCEDCPRTKQEKIDLKQTSRHPFQLYIEPPLFNVLGWKFYESLVLCPYCSRKRDEIEKEKRRDEVVNEYKLNMPKAVFGPHLVFDCNGRWSRYDSVLTSGASQPYYSCNKCGGETTETPSPMSNLKITSDHIYVAFKNGSSVASLAKDLSLTITEVEAAIRDGFLSVPDWLNGDFSQTQRQLDEQSERESKLLKEFAQKLKDL